MRYVNKFCKEHSEYSNEISNIHSASGSLRNSKIISFFCSYDKTEDKYSQSFFYNMFMHNKLRESNRVFKNSFASASESSVLNAFFKRLYHNLVSCSLHSYAIVMLCFSVYAIAINVLKYTIGNVNSIFIDDTFYAFVIFILSLILMPVRSSITVFFRKSKILSFISDCLFTSYNNSLSDQENTYVPGNATLILIGTVMGVLTYMIPAGRLIMASIFMIIILSLFKTPENALPLLIILCPFCRSYELLFLLFSAFSAYLFKVLRGKRSFSMKYFDMLVVFIAVTVFMGSFGSSGSSSLMSCATSTALVLAYFLFRNCVRTHEIAKKAIHSIAVSAGLASTVAIYNKLLYLGYISRMEGRINLELEFSPLDYFNDDKTLVIYLLVTMAFAITSSVIADRTLKKIIFTSSVLISSAVIVLSQSKEMLIAFAVCVFVYIIASLKKPLLNVVSVFLVYLVIVLMFFNPPFLSEGMFPGSAAHDNTLTQTSLKIASDNFLSGIGGGSSNFANVFNLYSHRSDFAPNSCENSYLQLFVQYGFLSFAFIIYFILQTYKMLFSNISKSIKTSANSALVSISAICVITTLLVIGVTEYVFNDVRVLFILFVSLGISAATYYIEREAVHSSFEVIK